MNQEEHKKIAQLYYEDKLFVGVDRVDARKFFTDIPFSKLAEFTNEKIYFQKLIVLFAFVLAPISLLLSIVMGFLAFKWLGILTLLICTIVYFLNQANSAKGGANLMITNILLGLIIISKSIYHYPNSDMDFGFLIFFILSLWLARFVYVASTRMFRKLVLKDYKMWNFFSSNIQYKPVVD